MLLFSDVRQGQFYAFLLSFWCIFVGEHILVRFQYFSSLNASVIFDVYLYHINREAQLDYKLDYKSHDKENCKDQKAERTTFYVNYLIDEFIDIFRC